MLIEFLDVLHTLLSATVCADDFLPDVLLLTALTPTSHPAKLQNVLVLVSRFTELSLQPSKASFFTVG